MRGIVACAVGVGEDCRVFSVTEGVGVGVLLGDAVADGLRETAGGSGAT